MKVKKQQKKNVEKVWFIAGCVLFAAGFLLLGIARNVDGFAQWYTLVIYPLLVGSIGRGCGLVPVSIVEMLLYIVLIVFLVKLICLLLRAVQHLKRNQGQAQEKMNEGMKTQIIKFVSGVFVFAGVLFFVYVTNCGINYQRNSFSECIGLETEEYTIEELKRVCVILTEDINARAKIVSRDQNGLMVLPSAEQKEAVQAMQLLAAEYEPLAGYYPQPKGLVIPWILSVQQLSGIYSPFTIEANYNSAMTAYNIPFTMCHELSHLRGFMQEQEANFIAYLACMKSENVEFQYSGSMLGWIKCMNVLYASDMEAWKEVRMTLDESVLLDLQDNSAFWARYDGKVAEVADMVNDSYLKANGQADGVKSYDRMVDLLVAYYR